MKKSIIILLLIAFLILIILSIFDILTNKYVIAGSYVALGLLVYCISKLKRQNRI